MDILLGMCPTVTFYSNLLAVLLASSVNMWCLFNVLEPRFRMYSERAASVRPSCETEVGGLGKMGLSWGIGGCRARTVL